MKLHIFTIVYNGMPYITWHLPMLNMLRQYGIDWHWHVVEGPAKNVYCTSWCKPLPMGQSTDGTVEYLATIKSHPRVSLYQASMWPGKVAMVNTPLWTIDEPCVLMEIDSDELWTAERIAAVMHEFEDKRHDYGAMEFFCQYFVGPNIVITSTNTYGNKPGEWRRAWRFTPGDSFEKHEPPVLRQQNPGNLLNRVETALRGLTFNHYAYTTPAQVAFKEKYYGYADALRHWERLQANTVWPVHLRNFLPWVKDGAFATLYYT